ncbi:MAG: ZIP family metal transporter [Candidatus Peregrinibacteria bacterium]
MTASPVLLTLISVLLVSGLSLIGLFFFALHASTIEKILLPIVGVSTGALLGDVFIHILPEQGNTPGGPVSFFILVLTGILASFVLEKFIHWRHCHLSALPDEHEHHHHPVGMMSLIGEGIHNFIDGALIAGSFLVSPVIGMATTLAVALHEIPHEIGNVAILLYSGFSRKRAIVLNILSGFIAVLGAICALIASTTVPFASQFILPFAAGNLLYIAGSDLIPELHKDTRLPQAFIQFGCILAGVGVMAALKVIG